MKARRLLVGLLALALWVGVSYPLPAQQGCPLPPAASAKHGPNIFNAQQETDLGDAMAEQFERTFKVIDDDDLRAFVDSIAARLAPHLPATGLQYRFFLVDLPYPNAFTLPGGRIYLTRKLVVFARSEDELAGVVAHEMAHVATRQPAHDVTRIFKNALGVTEVTDRNDIFEKYHLLNESVARNPGAFRFGEKHEFEEQVEADRFALYAVTRAGYAPRGYVDFFDRLAQTEGKTGSRLSDFFGVTKPDSRRLREMLKLSTALPEACLGEPAARPPQSFADWQTAVLGYAGLGRRESLRGVQAKKKLEPALRSDITHLRFSPDGRLVLAQDHASIFLLTREPLATLFRIDAPDAEPAQFTPDGAGVVFHTPALRVERWSLADEGRQSVHELVVHEGCRQTALSPDGSVLACLDGEFTLALIDVASGSRFFAKKEFFPPIRNILFLLMLLLSPEGEWIRMDFSPDGRYFLAANPRDALALDLTTRQPLKLPGRLNRWLRSRFTFLDSERLVAVNDERPDKSAVVRFPTGEELKQISVGRQKMTRASHGDFVLLRPIKDYAVGVFDLSKNEIFFASPKPALDYHHPLLVGEMKDGQVVLENAQERRGIASIPLPPSPLASLRALGVSSDLKYLAASTASRGAVWNLETGARVFHMRGFRGAYFDEDNRFYADFPKDEKVERRVMVFDLDKVTFLEGPAITDQNTRQHGSVLVAFKPRKEGESLEKDVILEVRDVTSGSTLWSHHFPKDAPDLFAGAGVLVLSWPVKANTAKDAINADPTLKARLKAMKEKEGDYYLEVWDARGGRVRGRLLVETSKGAFRVNQAFAAGDWMVLIDNTNRVLLYSLSSGELRGRVFGNRATVSSAAGLLAVENERGVLTLYDLASLEKRGDYVFSAPVSAAAFSPDGTRLLIVTASQTAYLLEVPPSGAAAQSR